MALQEIEFTSRNGRDAIQAWAYEPVGTPAAVVQIVHGLGEHSRRYLHMISALLDAGFVVVADDHAGHGRTAMQSGHWADAGDNSAEVVISDELTLQQQLAGQFDDLPWVVFGHSWGSLIARAMATRPNARLDGLALGGVVAQLRGLETTLDHEALAKAMATNPAGPAPESLVAQMFDGFTDRLSEGDGPTGWVARNRDVVADHGKDRFNNFGAPMSTRFLQGFSDIYDMANGEGFYAAMPKIPIALFAGSEDPAGNFGTGVQAVAQRLRRDGHDVELHLYDGLRHEVHNEPESRADVEHSLIAFVNRVADIKHS